MDVRNVGDVTPEVEHNGTVPVWWLIHPREMQDITDGGYLELANEFEVAVGGEVFPHTHPTHEFYFVMTGTGVMTVGDEERDVKPATSSTSRRTRSTACAPRATSRSTASASRWASRARGPIDYTTH